MAATDVGATSGPHLNDRNSEQQKDQYGSRLLPQVVDKLAQEDSARIYASIPLSSNLSGGFRDITMLEISQAVNKCAFWLEETMTCSNEFETIAYMGFPDLRYAIVFLAAVKCGYKVLVPSPRNSKWMNQSLLSQTHCTKFLCVKEMAQKIQALRSDNICLQIFTVDSLDEMLRPYHKHFPYERSFHDVRWDPVLILHSSGSTGPPKPITTNHGTWAVADNDRKLPPVKDRKTQSYAMWNFADGGRYFSAFPPFHLGGFMALVVLPIYSTSSSVVLGPPDKPPNGRLVSEIMQHYDLRALFCPPTIFEQLVLEPEGLEQMKRLDFILYAGGPLSTSTGNRLSQMTDVCQFYGSTETGAVPALVPRPEDWAYLEWHPSFRVNMQPFEDGAYEMVLNKDPALEGVRSLSCNFPSVEEWHTRDLFTQHPDHPGLWRFHGRTDDIIVLSTGAKFNPTPSEAIISGHSLVSGALIVGLGRFQPALLIEVRNGVDTSTESFIREIWTTVEQANSQAPGYARITRSMIALIGGAKQFERAGKGTVIRSMTADKFTREIDQLYSDSSLEQTSISLGSGNFCAMKKFVRDSINLSFSVAELTDDDDLYVRGLDSLKTAEITKLLKAGICKSEKYGLSDTTWLTPQALYEDPTIHKLSGSIYIKLNPDARSKEIANSAAKSRDEIIDSLVAKYTTGLPQLSPSPTKTFPRDHFNVALTGSTGSFGPHILHSLLSSPSVRQTYCLDRSKNAREKASARLFHSNLTSTKVRFLTVEYSHPQLNLPQEDYSDLVSTIDIIIHNAWKVDFNHSLSSFEPVHIKGLRNIIDISINSPRHPQIVFISSTSSVGNWQNVYPAGPVPEEPQVHHAVAQEMGYAESKHVAECILYAASVTARVPVSVLRVGQIAGPVATPGAWSKSEWLPSLMQTSKAIGCLPHYVPDADWIPVDLLGKAVVDIALNASMVGDGAGWYNLVNPTATPWSQIIQVVRARLGSDVQVVDFGRWIELLDAVDPSNRAELADKPAVKILKSFKAFEKQEVNGSLRFETDHARSASRTMAELEPVSIRWMETWLSQLGY